MKIIYWAVKLGDKSKTELLNAFRPIHKKIFGEHMTLAFNPDQATNEMMEKIAGQVVSMKVIGMGSDNNGQAVVVEPSVNRIDGEVNHITISCAEKVSPVYSIKLLNQEYRYLKSNQITLTGTIQKFTDKGWK